MGVTRLWSTKPLQPLDIVLVGLPDVCVVDKCHNPTMMLFQCDGTLHIMRLFSVCVHKIYICVKHAYYLILDASGGPTDMQHSTPAWTAELCLLRACWCCIFIFFLGGQVLATDYHLDHTGRSVTYLPLSHIAAQVGKHPHLYAALCCSQL